ncbi:hypothetical protein RB597_001530 [Gaeumannomyces tritici]
MSPATSSPAGLWPAMTFLLALLPTGGFAQNDGCGSVTISSAEDAARIGRNCRVIEGNILWAQGLAGKITLDGVEINYWGNVRSIEMPLLESVDEGFSVTGRSVQHLDITSLERVGLRLDISGHLQTLSHRRLLEYNLAPNDYPPAPVTLGGVASIDSCHGRARISGAVDYKGKKVNRLHLDLNSNYLPNVAHFSLAWTDLLDVSVGQWLWIDKPVYPQQDITLELGSGSTEPQVISELRLYSGIVGVRQMHLSGDWLLVKNTNLTSLMVPHRKLERLEVRNNSRLTSIKLLPSVSDGANLSVITIEQKDAHLKRWSWPKGPIRVVEIEARIGEEFL